MHHRSKSSFALVALAIATCLPALAEAGDASVADGACVVDTGPPEEDAPDDAPFCCTQQICSQVGAACNQSTCRCDRAPCESASVPCACSLFGDDCPAGASCVMLADPHQPPSTGNCVPLPPPGQTPEGEGCFVSWECSAGLLCYAASWSQPPKCVKPSCGLAAGAPSCPPGTFCDPMDDFWQMGACRVPCNRYDEATPCAPNEICARHGSHDACFDVGVGPLPHAGAACASNNFASDLCAPGSACVDGWCVRACDMHASGAGAPGVCPAGQDCVPVSDGVCAPPCDPFSPTPASECSAGFYCAIEALPCAGVAGHCVPTADWLPKLGESCGDRCSPGLACSGGHSRQCLPVCRVSAKSGEEGACGAGEHCFASIDPGSLTQLGYGVCSPPCVAGGTDCAIGQWCDPLELDPATNSWIGMCTGSFDYDPDAGPDTEDASADAGVDASLDSGAEAGGKAVTAEPSNGCSCRSAEPRDVPSHRFLWLGVAGVVALRGFLRRR